MSDTAIKFQKFRAANVLQFMQNTLNYESQHRWYRR